jgi:aspartate ammonia-lyase
MSDRPTRLEHDLLGEKAVPAEAYYGVQTARASRISTSPAFSSTCIPI